MTMYNCERCGYETVDRGNLIKHLQKKKPCETKFSDTDRETLIKLSHKIIYNDDDFKCKYCAKPFKVMNSVYRHFPICEKNPEKNTSALLDKLKKTEECNKELNKQIKNLYNEIDELKKKLAIHELKRNEEFFQNLLEVHFKCGHMKLKNGITDISNDNMHIEIKNWDSVKEAVGQLVYYNIKAPREDLRVYFFGKCSKDKKDETVIDLAKVNIKCYEFIETYDDIKSICLNDNEVEMLYDKRNSSYL